MLSSWFKAPLIRTTVILTHEMGSNRLVLVHIAAVHIAAVLIEKVFSTFLYNTSSHCRSSGNLGTWGWLEVKDLKGAADYLLTRSDVDPKKI